MVSAVSPTSPSSPADVLLLDSDTSAGYAAVLQGSYRVATPPGIEAARQILHRQSPALVVTELQLQDGSGIDLCREVKRLPSPPSVLITTSETERIPDALIAGCDGVLLKPFAPNLLYARVGRLLRARAEAVRMRARMQQAKSQHVSERSDLLLSGTNRVWPNTHCLYCDHAGVTSFEFASYRRAWYACLECKKVWIAKRQE